jgi:hypothetical protein
MPNAFWDWAASVASAATPPMIARMATVNRFI